MLAVATTLLLAFVASSTSTESCVNGNTDSCGSVTGAPTEVFDQNTDWNKATSIYQFNAVDINGQNVSLEKYRGHVLIVVNVASNCGLTENNYKQLETLYEKYGATKGLRILGFPANQFAGQEPGNSSDIIEFIKQYNVQFDMFQKIKVNGGDTHPLWKWLKTRGTGFLTNDIKWNFTKFLIDKDGQVIERFSPSTEPLSFEDKLKRYF